MVYVPWRTFGRSALGFAAVVCVLLAIKAFLIWVITMGLTTTRPRAAATSSPCRPKVGGWKARPKQLAHHIMATGGEVGLVGSGVLG